MASWYVAYKHSGGTVMHVYGQRDAAIAAACDLLGNGHNVTEVAPISGELPESAGLDGAEIRQLVDRANNAITGVLGVALLVGDVSRWAEQLVDRAQRPGSDLFPAPHCLPNLDDCRQPSHELGETTRSSNVSLDIGAVALGRI